MQARSLDLPHLPRPWQLGPAQPLLRRRRGWRQARTAQIAWVTALLRWVSRRIRTYFKWEEISPVGTALNCENPVFRRPKFGFLPGLLCRQWCAADRSRRYGRSRASVLEHPLVAFGADAADAVVESLVEL